MNSTVFEKWFLETLLPSIPIGATIIMDNAPYHSRVVDRAPTMKTKKSDIIEWLTRKGVECSEHLIKLELLELVKKIKPRRPEYILDKEAERQGYRVLRLPPYHCEYNPIEMVWAWLKSYVKERNNSYRLKDVEILFMEAVKNFTPDLWKNT